MRRWTQADLNKDDATVIRDFLFDCRRRCTNDYAPMALRLDDLMERVRNNSNAVNQALKVTKARNA